ncbi:uncharacterized protein FOMMEDRAFT_97039 [Fomitiporia mediterranea MF3/22]|uniref:uncharacterized protein n=1 Tax=Fomitiporia mediterranea (strain MF3/22) TaxID=694068 RepID=UPI000440784C|nr:uncharacterized protein FOMMEDRAFT_97039 [Fomitiporia mediterranea MF3/22]EJC98251.1 hypothetical protein FOMMEDRAFT_97039 [Fomitiporia mediterranea MF3/22]
MSRTQTKNNVSARNNNAQNATTSTVLLTPQKRKRLSPESSLTSCTERSPSSKKAQAKHDIILECRRKTSHSLTELYKWTFTQAAVAPVRVKHVFEMDHEGNDNEEFYWMGRVPCRTVKIVGMVVGVDEFDDMLRFKVDDGTSVIDCDLKQPKPAKPPSTPESRLTVGAIVTVQGRIFHGRGSRYLRLEPAICKSANDEPRHWLEVLKLCHEHYYLPDPFVIPKLEPQLDANPVASSSKDPVAQSSPASVSSPVGTESSRSSTSSPQRPRLRHPSRLRSRDLTDVTFRIYVKHYMDFAPPCRPSRVSSSDEDEDDPIHFNDPCATPTPKSRHRRCHSPLLTPKPRKILQTTNQAEDEETQYGFTLGYLRRVPVLAEMALAVVWAEGKRREREKRKREKEKGLDCRQTQASNSSNTSSRFKSNGASDPEQVARNMKRLFQKTIRELHKAGNIVIWNGPARPIEHASDADGDDSGLWKNSNGSMPLPSTASTVSSVTSSGPSQEEQFAGYLSDPDDQEESYLPITPRTLSPIVMRALRTLTGIDKTARTSSRKQRPPTADELASYLQRSDAQWTNLGSWDVQDALERLLNEDRVFKAGGGRWAVCS